MMCLFLREVPVKRVQLVFPEGAVVGEPLCGLLEGLNCKTAAPNPPGLFLRHQARILEHPQVLHHSGKGDAVGARQFRDGGLSS